MNFESLQTVADNSHEAFSTAFEEQQQALGALGAASKLRVDLVAAIESKDRLLTSLRAAAVDAAIRGADNFSMAVATVRATADELVLIRQALRKFTAFDLADAELASLVARLATLEKQEASERARLALHIAEVQEDVRYAVLRDGAVQIAMGPATMGLKELIEQIARDADAVRKRIKEHATETLVLRKEYEEGQ